MVLVPASSAGDRGAGAGVVLKGGPPDGAGLSVEVLAPQTDGLRDRHVGATAPSVGIPTLGPGGCLHPIAQRLGGRAAFQVGQATAPGRLGQ